MGRITLFALVRHYVPFHAMLSSHFNFMDLRDWLILVFATLCWN